MAKLKSQEEKQAEAFSLQVEITKLENNPRRDMNILALYFEERSPDLRNKEQYQVAISRHIKAARLLVPFDDDQIISAIGKAKEFVPGWTLETIIKLLTK